MKSINLHSSDCNSFPLTKAEIHNLFKTEKFDTFPRTKRERVTNYYNLVIQKALSALAAPICAFDFLTGLYSITGYDIDLAPFQLFDEALARQSLGFSNKMTQDEINTAIEREANRRRKQRTKILEWQAIKDNPILIEYDGSYNPDTRQKNCTYRSPFTGLVRDIIDTAPVGSSEKRLNDAVRRHTTNFLESFSGAAKRSIKKREHSPESDLKRSATMARKAFDREAQKSGNQSAFNLLVATFQNEFSLENYPQIHKLFTVLYERISTQEECFEGEKVAVFEHSENTNPLNSDNFPSDPVSKPSCTPGAEILPAAPELYATLSYKECVVNPLPESKEISRTVNSIGMEDDEFWRQIEKENKTARRQELEDAYVEALSLDELQRFDPRAKIRCGAESRFSCPRCHGAKKFNKTHRCVAVNMATGDYYCHRCNRKGRLREFWKFQPSQLPAPKISPAAPKVVPMAPSQPDDRWRRWYREAEGIIRTPGAEYLAEMRGVDTEIADGAGVKYSPWFLNGAVLFPVKDQNGDLVGFDARAVGAGREGMNKLTKGEKSKGVFLGAGDVFDSPSIAITEAPIDALVLQSVGLPSIATCGCTNWPEWLDNKLAGKDILLANDFDDAGEQASIEQDMRLSRTCFTMRMRPDGGKDWGEVAINHGLDEVKELVRDYLNAL